jgi:hypothetical protein
MQQGVEVSGFIDIDPKKEGSIRQGLPVYSHEQIREDTRNTFYLGYVTRWDAREFIRQYLNQKGKKEGNDFVIL